MCIVVLGGADLTSTSYVYSSLVVHNPGRVAARAPVHPAVLHLGVCDVQLADHVALVGLVVAQVVVGVFDDGVVVQRPGAPGRRRALDVAHQEDGLVGVHHLLAEGGQDLGSAVCKEGRGAAGKGGKEYDGQTQDQSAPVCLISLWPVGMCDVLLQLETSCDETTQLFRMPLILLFLHRSNLLWLEELLCSSFFISDCSRGYVTFPCIDLADAFVSGCNDVASLTACSPGEGTIG